VRRVIERAERASPSNVRRASSSCAERASPSNVRRASSNVRRVMSERQSRERVAPMSPCRAQERAPRQSNARRVQDDTGTHADE
jgi:hypothetical protein